jgi:hypothetical protein
LKKANSIDSFAIATNSAVIESNSCNLDETGHVVDKIICADITLL